MSLWSHQLVPLRSVFPSLRHLRGFRTLASVASPSSAVAAAVSSLSLSPSVDSLLLPSDWSTLDALAPTAASAPSPSASAPAVSSTDNSAAPLPQPRPELDPFALIRNDLDNLTPSIKGLLTVDEPVLQSAAQYFFERQGKRLRPALVLLLARSLSQPFSSTTADAQRRQKQTLPPVPAKAARLAEITELIHTASLAHDDVIDKSPDRRGVPTLHMMFDSNKVAILAETFS